ncbi:hypothetical protein SAMN05880566_114139 [Janthinobacterium sp. TND4EL3]|nr:hypothetical protein SAMN05880566_114139 [Janthinobacterium sp. TND4EL3]
MYVFAFNYVIVSFFVYHTLHIVKCALPPTRKWLPFGSGDIAENKHCSRCYC